MGLFDFLKKKEAPKQTEQPKAITSEPYLGDLDKTNIIFNLVQTPVAERDSIWQNQFLENLPLASFRCGDPQVITGPDGFPYFQLLLPEENKSFQCYVIDNMKDDFLLDSGFGVVINPTATSADWVLSYGDILNYHLNKTFYSENKTTGATGKITITQKEEVLIGQPSETLFPAVTRKLIRELLQNLGIQNPKVLLMMRKQGSQEVSQDIVFNLIPEDFENEEMYEGVMQTISWYFPKHYSFIGTKEDTFSNGFEDL